MEENNKEKHRGEKKRLLKELEYLKKTFKAGILPMDEYNNAKKAIETKIRTVEQRVKQDEAKEKAVENIIGRSLVPKHVEFARKTGQEYQTKRHHEKYFVKIHNHKEQKEKKVKSTAEKPYSDKIEPKIESAEQPSTAKYKDIDELVETDNTNWRFALAILTIFLLILLYVKFTSIGTMSDVVTMDIYLDYNSKYSHEMYTTLQSIKEEYGEIVLIEYHLVGDNPQSMLASEAIACAEEQERGQEYRDYLFSLDTTVWATISDLVSYAEMFGYDTSLFKLCLEGGTKSQYYMTEQESAKKQGVEYTPTIFINNKKIVGAVDYETIKAVLESEMTSLG